MSFRVDLHCHSICSDGTDSPQDLLYLAKEVGLTGLCITDHDTTGAYTKSLFLLAQKLNLKLITGAEISSQVDNESVHILAYNCDINSESLQNFLKEVRKKREARNRVILEKLAQQNMPISEKELLEFALNKQGVSKTTLGRPHIAQIMKNKGYISDIQQGFDKYLKDHGACYVAGERFSCAEVIKNIHLAQGKAVLAHPSQIKSSKIMKKLLEMPFDGIEAYYARLHFNQEKKWLQIAKEKGLIATGGSDFHGTIKPFLTLGCSWSDEETFNKLIS